MGLRAVHSLRGGVAIAIVAVLVLPAFAAVAARGHAAVCHCRVG